MSTETTVTSAVLTVAVATAMKLTHLVKIWMWDSKNFNWCISANED